MAIPFQGVATQPCDIKNVPIRLVAGLTIKVNVKCGKKLFWIMEIN
jgi:hypothetical protein